MADEKRFDRQIADMLSELTPDSAMTRRIVPWRHAMTLILWGLGVSLFTVNFSSNGGNISLRDVQIVAGTLLQYLGFRSLRRANGWIRGAFGISGALLVLRWLWAVLQATPLVRWIGTGGTMDIAFFCGMQLMLFFCLWRGLRQVFLDAGLVPKVGAAGWLVVWDLFMLLLQLCFGTITISALWIIPIGIFFSAVMRSLWKTALCLEEAGYAIEPAPVRISGRWLMVIIVVTTAAALAVIGQIRWYPTDMQLRSADEQAGYEMIRQGLEELGYPAEYLADLSGEDLALCEGATAVYVTDVADDWKYGWPGFCITDVEVWQGAYQKQLFQHFEWKKEEPSVQTALMWRPSWEEDTYASWTNLRGRLLFESEEGTMAAPCELELKNADYENQFFGRQQYSAYYDEFSMPAGGERYRGYLACSWTWGERRWRFAASDVSFCYQLGVNYPWRSAMDMALGGMTGNYERDGFCSLQHYRLNWFSEDELLQAMKEQEEWNNRKPWDGVFPDEPN